MSADVSDDATDQEIQEIERRIAERRIAERRHAAAQDELARNRPLPETCANDCGDAPRERSRWCSAECRSDFDRRVGLERRAGKR